MPDQTQTPAVTPGVETTEYKIHKYVMLAGGALTAALAICSQIKMFAPSGSKMDGYLELAATVGAAGLLVLKDLGYSSDRSDQKVEAIKAQGAINAAQKLAEASQNAGAAAKASE